MRIARFVCMLLLAAGILEAFPAPSQAQVAVGVSIRIGPPVLPVYAQPICPEPGLLWTPGYWGWNEGFYVWHAGYWGPTVGFYGGVNYGFGYTGVGFFGGYWRGGNYYYNRSVTNVNVNIVHNTYNTTVINNNTNITRVSYNGGPGGLNARPNREEVRAERERHVSMTSEQNQHFEAARGDRSLRSSVNHGRPDVAASSRAGEFHGRPAFDNGRQGNPNRSDNRSFENGRGGNPNRPDNRIDNRGDSNRPGRQQENNGRNFPDRPGRSEENNGRNSSDRPGRPMDNGGRGSSDRPPF